MELIFCAAFCTRCRSSTRSEGRARGEIPEVARLGSVAMATWRNYIPCLGCVEKFLRFFLFLQSAAGFTGALAFSLFQPLPNSLFDSLIRGAVINAVTQVIGKALHGCNFRVEIVCVLISATISETFHQ